VSTESASGDPDPTTAPAVTELPPDTPRVRIDGPAPTQEPMTTLVLGHGRDPGSARALQVAADLAGRLHAHLHVVHGVDLDDYPIKPGGPSPSNMTPSRPSWPAPRPAGPTTPPGPNPRR